MAYEGYADPGFQRELDKLPKAQRDRILSTLAELADDPFGHPRTRRVQGARWPGTVRVRVGPYRVLALVLPRPELILFTTLFRKRRASDYDQALERHDARVAGQGPPLDDFLQDVGD